MKSGKEEEKKMGPPMFPRLHVNDADKGGGPRAPPRNKMALYEQLSIPSQRFSSKPLPLSHPNSTSNMVPSASSSQASGVERNMVYPRHVPPSTPTRWPEKFQAHCSDVSYGNAPEAQLEQQEKAGQEDEDFIVPVFVQAKASQSHGRTQNSNERETLSSISSIRSGQPVERQRISNKDLKQNNLTAGNRRQEVRSESNENLNACGESANGCVISAAGKSTREKSDGPLKEAEASSNKQRGGHVVSNLSRSRDGEACLHQESRIETQLDSARQGDGLVDSARDTERGNASQRRSESRCGEEHSRHNEPEIDSEYNRNGNRTCISSQIENVDKGDDLSETSMVDSISGLDISPDDVVGIIGQKHFWKARRAINHQQRVFAVQVFELHRLIKVQRLIAESPHVMLEDGAFLGKSSLKGSPVRKFPLGYVVKSPPHVTNCKDDSEKPNHKMECSAENAVGKTSLSFAKSASQSLNYGSYMGNSQPVGTTDNTMGPWCFHQSPGPQWLVPVMSPSEGLIYKPMPYPGPGLMGTASGGCGPFGSAPMTSNFMNSAYGIPAPHHQGIGVLPGSSPVGHMYFPPYGMPVINPAMSGSTVEQVNPFVGPGPQSQTGPVSGGGVNSSMEQQSSCNVPTQKNASVPQGRKFQASKSSDLQGSTDISPAKRAKGVVVHNSVEGQDPHPLFPMAPVVLEGATQSQDAIANQPTRAIKVVPHNPRSATESAARIFRFIQEERKQYDSV